MNLSIFVSWVQVRLGSTEARRGAVASLATRESRSAISLLVRCLRDSDAGVRGAAANALAKRSGAALVDPLLASLESTPEAESALMRLETAGTSALRNHPGAAMALLRVLREGGAEGQVRAGRLLAWLGPDVARHVAEALRSDPGLPRLPELHELVAKSAVESPLLAEAASHQDPRVRTAIVRGLTWAASHDARLPSDVQAVFRRLLADRDEAVQKELAKAVRPMMARGAIGAELWPVLSKHPSADVRVSLVSGLEAVARSRLRLRETSEVPALLNRLMRDSDRGVRSTAARTLTDLGIVADDADLKLTQAVETRDWRTLSAIGKNAIATFRSCLDSPTFFKGALGERVRCIEALATVREDAAAELLSRELRSTEAKIAAAAIQGLTSLGAIGIKYLRSHASGVHRRAVIDCLASRPEPDAIPLLSEALRDPNSSIRQRAHEGLQAAGWVPVSDEHKVLCAYYASDWPGFLAHSDAAAKVAALLAGSVDGDGSRARNAIRALGAQKDVRAVSFLLAYLKRTDDLGEAAARAATELLPNPRLEAALLTRLASTGSSVEFDALVRSLSTARNTGVIAIMMRKIDRLLQEAKVDRDLHGGFQEPHLRKSAIELSRLLVTAFGEDARAIVLEHANQWTAASDLISRDLDRARRDQMDVTFLSGLGDEERAVTLFVRRPTKESAIAVAQLKTDRGISTLLASLAGDVASVAPLGGADAEATHQIDHRNRAAAQLATVAAAAEAGDHRWLPLLYQVASGKLAIDPHSRAAALEAMIHLLKKPANIERVEVDLLRELSVMPDLSYEVEIEGRYTFFHGTEEWVPARSNRINSSADEIRRTTALELKRRKSTR